MDPLPWLCWGWEARARLETAARSADPGHAAQPGCRCCCRRLQRSRRLAQNADPRPPVVHRHPPLSFKMTKVRLPPHPGPSVALLRRMQHHEPVACVARVDWLASPGDGAFCLQAVLTPLALRRRCRCCFSHR